MPQQPIGPRDAAQFWFALQKAAESRRKFRHGHRYQLFRVPEHRRSQREAEV